MGALCPKPKKEDNTEEDYKKFLEDFANEVCDGIDGIEQCKRNVIGKDKFNEMLNSVLKQKKKSEDPKEPEDPKKLRFN